MFFLWSLSDSKSPQDSRTLLTIQGDLSKTVVWIVSTRSFISKSSNPFVNTLVIVPGAAMIIGINVNFMFHSFFQFHCKVEVFIFLFTFFKCYSVISRDSEVHNFQWITLHTQLCFVLYPFSTNLLHSLIMCLLVSSLSPLNVHLQFCCVLSLLALVWLDLIVLFWQLLEENPFLC